MSLWVAAVMAKGYQQEAELDPFRAGCSWHSKPFLPNELCQCDVMGYPAPRLPANESRFYSLKDFACHPGNTPANRFW